MGHRRDEVVDRALAVLDRHGLADLTMRRLGAELGVQPSALYHHFRDKQTMLAAVADEILARGGRPAATGSWSEILTATCSRLRDSLLAYRDGAEVVATAYAFGLGARSPYDDLVAALRAGGADPALAATAARTLLHFVFGHVSDEQQRLQAAGVGAVDADPTDPAAASDFPLALALVVDGIRGRVGAGSR